MSTEAERAHALVLDEALKELLKDNGPPGEHCYIRTKDSDGLPDLEFFPGYVQIDGYVNAEILEALAAYIRRNS